jgi:hypothetical protein
MVAQTRGAPDWRACGRGAGRYFLSAHGHLTPVSRAVFLYSWWHNALTVAGFVVAIGAAIWLRDLTDRAKRAALA